MKERIRIETRVIAQSTLVYDQRDVIMRQLILRQIRQICAVRIFCDNAFIRQTVEIQLAAEFGVPRVLTADPRQVAREGGEEVVEAVRQNHVVEYRHVDGEHQLTVTETCLWYTRLQFALIKFQSLFCLNFVCMYKKICPKCLS